ncbi:hypothetical protein [Enterococcus gilvus]|uniref:serine O-acetyltransferase n=1 Tax=Enterococcus gilvus TaxID=160453 RepID=UPI0021AB1A5C
MKIRFKLTVFTCFLPILTARKAIWLYASTKNSLIKKLCTIRLKKYCVIITNGAIISPNTIFPHPQNIVIGGGVQIEGEAVIYQGVTLGLRNGREHIPVNKNFDYYPKIRSGAVIYTNSVIIGNIEIGKQAVVGANSFVNKEVLPRTIVGGNPARCVTKI